VRVLVCCVHCVDGDWLVGGGWAWRRVQAQQCAIGKAEMEKKSAGLLAKLSLGVSSKYGEASRQFNLVVRAATVPCRRCCVCAHRRPAPGDGIAVPCMCGLVWRPGDVRQTPEILEQVDVTIMQYIHGFTVVATGVRCVCSARRPCASGS
jgi:hypothetical protein